MMTMIGGGYTIALSSTIGFSNITGQEITLSDNTTFVIPPRQNKNPFFFYL
jgi:hypothetical protein